MNLKKVIVWILLGVFILLAFYSKNYRPNKQQEKINKKLELATVKVGMGFIPNIQFAPFYVALDKGFFTDQGLSLDFNYGLETDIIALLANKELDIGIGSGEQVILAQAKDLPIVNFFNWYQRFPVCLMSLAEKKINDPQDLKGKIIGIPVMQGASFIGLQALLLANNLSQDQVNIQSIGYTQAESLIAGKVDAAVCYTINEPVNLKNQGYQLNLIEVADYVNFVSNGLLTNQQIINQQPEMLKAFIMAFLKGVEFTITNPDEAFTIAKKYIPEIENEQVQKQVLLESLKIWQVTDPGLNDVNQWQESLEFLTKIGLVEKDLEANSLFTNQFLPYEKNNRD